MCENLKGEGKLRWKEPFKKKTVTHQVTSLCSPDVRGQVFPWMKAVSAVSGQMNSKETKGPGLASLEGSLRNERLVASFFFIES